jgi:hypothetical protein
MMTIEYGLQFFFFELTDNDGQHFLAGIVPSPELRESAHKLTLNLLPEKSKLRYQKNLQRFSRLVLQ